jgi:hypothetical protein
MLANVDTAIRGFHRLAVSTAAIDTKSGAASAKRRAGTRKSTVTLSPTSHFQKINSAHFRFHEVAKCRAANAAS